MEARLYIPYRHRVFAILYFFTSLVLLMEWANMLPMANVFRKVKYLYIVFMILLCIRDRWIRKNAKISYGVLGMMYLHTILFGFVFINDSIEGAIHDHAMQMIVYLSMVMVTFTYIVQNNIFELFVNISYLVAGIQLLFSAVCHPGDFVNPLWGIVQTFTATFRYKNSFGFVHPGFLANECFLVFVLSILFWEVNKDKNAKRKKIVLCEFFLFDAIAFLMLIAAAERAGILSVAMLIIFYLFFSYTGLLRKKSMRLALPFIIIISIFAVVDSGLWAHIWENSNRELNITVNYPAFKQIGNIWTGMGYVGSDAFQKGSNVFSVTTSSLDMYYVYLFFTTGIIGCAIYGTSLVIILMKLVRGKKDSLGTAFLSIYISMLFLAFWQPSLFTYRYQSCFYLLVIMLVAISGGRCLGRNG